MQQYCGNMFSLSIMLIAGTLAGLASGGQAMASAASAAGSAFRLDAGSGWNATRAARRLLGVPSHWCSCCSAEACSNGSCWWVESGNGDATNCSCSCCGRCDRNTLYNNGYGLHCNTYGELARNYMLTLATQHAVRTLGV